MLDTLFTPIFESTFTGTDFLICTAAALAFGIMFALTFCRKDGSSRSFRLTLILLPAAVQTVILLVNGNVGTGVAVMGAFSLVRFRSVPGSAKEIAAIFMAMTAVLMRMKLTRKLIMMMKPIEKSPLTIILWMTMPITHRSRLHTGMKVLIQTIPMASIFRSCLRMTA